MSSQITYSRKAHKRQRLRIESDDENDDISPSPDSPAPIPPVHHARKRPRVQVEVVLPLSPSKSTPSPPKAGDGRGDLFTGSSRKRFGGESPERGQSPKKRAQVEVLLPSPHRKSSSPWRVRDVAPSSSGPRKVMKYAEESSDRGHPEGQMSSPKKRLKVEVLLQSPRKRTPSSQKVREGDMPFHSSHKRRTPGRESPEVEHASSSKKPRSTLDPKAFTSYSLGSSMKQSSMRQSSSTTGKRASTSHQVEGNIPDEDDTLPVLKEAAGKLSINVPQTNTTRVSGSNTQFVDLSTKGFTSMSKTITSRGKLRNTDVANSVLKPTSRPSMTIGAPAQKGHVSWSPTKPNVMSTGLSRRPITPPPQSRHLPATVSSPSKPLVTYLTRTPTKSFSFDSSSPLTPLPHESPLARTSSTPMKPLELSRTPTPKSPAKDLSKLFKFDSIKAGPSRSPPKPKLPIAKRMLSRSRTESSLDSFLSKRNDSIISISSSGSPRRLGSSRTGTFIDIADAGTSQSPSSPNGSAMPINPATDVEPQMRPAAVPLPQPQIRTYAGKSRSFLVPLPAEGAPGPPQDNDDLGIEEMRESYTDLRLRWGVDNSEDELRPLSPSPEPTTGKGKGKAKQRSRVVLPPGMMNDLKSITELRSKGESRRFIDEVGYLFEGMDMGVGLGVRRGRQAVLILLCEPDFARRAKATDFVFRAWEALRGAGAGDGDKVLDAVLVLFAALISQTPRDLQHLAQNSDFVSTLCEILPSVERNKDPILLVSRSGNDLELKKIGFGKPEKSMLASLKTVIIKKSGLVTLEDCPPLRQLISLCLATLHPRSLRSNQFRFMHETLLPELSLLPPRLSAYAAGLPLLPERSLSSGPDTPSFDHIEHCLRILDSFLLGRWTEDDERDSLCDDVISSQGQEDLMDGLVSVCVACNIILKDTELKDHHAIASKCLESALRVLINLSHDNRFWCKLLLHHELMMPVVISLISRPQQQARSDLNDKKPIGDSGNEAEDGESDAQAFDRLCLALGLLTNLVQAGDDAKDICRETRMNPSCPGKRACARICYCPERIGALECLVRVYLHHCRREALELVVDADDPGAHIVRGHLAVLFGLLMRQSAANQAAVLEALPGSTRRAKLDALVGHARDFVGLYAAFMVRVAGGVGEKNGEDQEDEEDEGQEGGKRARISVEKKGREGADADVARDIVAFLQMLRDQ
ncbi:hypothetical protein EW146_g3475 [Bondarzewia mesenterica]|uniref:Wings apart-like protein C-terminal domain-containing protein n=1 Tax=Bondarzewia mesenterica TaxID=1095465 RepID=A0A4S4LZN6_9AGAM|nr:hypothetical protein EW146_g3475 [Bondarzewia mesenterica]